MTTNNRTPDELYRAAFEEARRRTQYTIPMPSPNAARSLRQQLYNFRNHTVRLDSNAAWMEGVSATVSRNKDGTAVLTLVDGATALEAALNTNTDATPTPADPTDPTDRTLDETLRYAAARVGTYLDDTNDTVPLLSVSELLHVYRKGGTIHASHLHANNITIKEVREAATHDTVPRNSD